MGRHEIAIEADDELELAPFAEARRRPASHSPPANNEQKLSRFWAGDRAAVFQI